MTSDIDRISRRSVWGWGYTSENENGLSSRGREAAFDPCPREELQRLQVRDQVRLLFGADRERGPHLAEPGAVDDLLEAERRAVMEVRSRRRDSGERRRIHGGEAEHRVDPVVGV